MKQFNGFEDAKKNAEYTGAQKLPEGAYVVEIKNVKWEEGKNGNSDYINVLFDIIEGDYKDFFKNHYEANTNEDKKWKGRTTIYCPKDDGTEQDGWTKNSFAKWTNSFEKSNSGYSWDWDEQKWKGKKIGLVFRTTGTVIEGKEVTYTEVAFPIDIESVRTGKAPAAKFKAKNGYTGNGTTHSASDNSFVNIPDGTDDEIPF